MYSFKNWVVGLAMAVGIVQGAPAPKLPCTTKYPDDCPRGLCAIYFNECGEAYGGCFLDPACGGTWPVFPPPPCPYGYTPYPDYDSSGAPYSTYAYDGPYTTAYPTYTDGYYPGYPTYTPYPTYPVDPYYTPYPPKYPDYVDPYPTYPVDPYYTPYPPKYPDYVDPYPTYPVDPYYTPTEYPKYPDYVDPYYTPPYPDYVDPYPTYPVDPYYTPTYPDYVDPYYTPYPDYVDPYAPTPCTTKPYYAE